MQKTNKNLFLTQLRFKYIIAHASISGSYLHSNDEQSPKCTAFCGSKEVQLTFAFKNSHKIRGTEFRISLRIPFPKYNYILIQFKAILFWQHIHYNSWQFCQREIGHYLAAYVPDL